MVYGLLYLAFGILALLYGGSLLKQRRRTRSWPTVTGQMLERKVEPSPGGRAGRLGPPAFSYEALVKYSYRVEGREYTNDKLYHTGWVANTKENREELLATLPDSIEVHYDPAKPEDSCLLAPSVGMAMWGLVFGAIVTLTALLYLLVTLLNGA